MTRWVPLEANPTVLTDFARTLGMKPELQFTDVWSAELLDLVPAPRYAVLLLYPLTPALRDASTGSGPAKQGAVFVNQTIGNACGTIALLHALLQPSTVAMYPPVEGSALARLGAEFAGKSPAECATVIEASTALDSAQQEFAQRGQTAAPGADENIDLHFVCFVHHEGQLIQLDGRLDQPVAHGETTPDTLLQDACKVVKSDFMARDEKELRFTIIALTQNAQD